MVVCFLSLLTASVFWTIQPIYNSQIVGLYEEKNYKDIGLTVAKGFGCGLLGTLFFVIANKLCDSLSTSVAYTYALPIVFTTLASKFLYNEDVGLRKWLGILVITVGLYLMI